MKRVKFPRTRRDRFKDREKKSSHFQDLGDVEPRRTNIYNPRKLRFSTVNSQSEPPTKYTLDKYLGYAALYHPQAHPGPDPRLYEPQQGDEEAQLPLATNAESWANLPVGMSTPAGSMSRNSTGGSVPSLSASQTGLEGTTLELTGRHPPPPEYEEEDDEVFTNLDRQRNEEQTESFPSMDTVDQGAQQGGATGVDMFFCCFGIFSYLMDIGTDLFLAYEYFKLEHYYWFSYTLGFILVPSLVMTVFSLILYLRDWRIMGEEASPPRWASRTIFLIFQLAPLIRILESTFFACKSRTEKNVLQRREYYDRWLDEGTDAMLLRLFEAFLEAAPQLVLQIYIISQLGTSEGALLVVFQMAGLLTSWLTMTSTIVTFHKSLRLSQPKKSKLHLPGMATMFFWRLFTIASRVMALALFASVFKLAIFGVVAAHWVLMLVWMFMQDTDYCMLVDRSGRERKSPILEFGFRAVGAFIHIFCFFNLIEGHTRLRCVTYYTIVYIENVAMVMTWFFVASQTATVTWYFVPALLIVLLGFWIGIFFQVIYYKFFHPNNLSVLHVRKRIRWCIPRSDMYLCKERGMDRVDGGASERALSPSSRTENPLQTSTPAPSLYSYQSPRRPPANRPAHSSTPAASLYSYASPAREVVPQPTPNRGPPTTNRGPPTTNRGPPTTNRGPPTTNRGPPITNMMQPTPNRGQHQPQEVPRQNNVQGPPNGIHPSNQAANGSHVYRPPPVKRMLVQAKIVRGAPSPIHGPLETPFVRSSNLPQTKAFSPPHVVPPSPIKPLGSAPPLDDTGDSTEEPLPKSARASLPKEIPAPYVAPVSGPPSSEHTPSVSLTASDISLDNLDTIVNKPLMGVTDSGLVKLTKVVNPSKRAPPVAQAPYQAIPGKPLQREQYDGSESGSYSESETDENEFGPGSPKPVTRTSSVHFGPPDGPTDEYIPDPTKRRSYRPPTPRDPYGRESPSDMSGGRRSPRDMSGGRRSPRDMSGGRRSPQDMSGGRRSPSDMSGGRRSPRDMSGGRRSPRDMSGGRRSPQDMSGGRRSPRDLSGGRISPRDMSSGRRSPRDMSGGRHSPRDMSGGRQSPRDMSGGRQSPRDMSGGRQSPRDVSGGRQSPRDMSGGRQSPRDMSGGRHSPRDMSGGRQSPRDMSGGRHSPRDMSGGRHSPRDMSGGRHSPRDVSGGRQSPRDMSGGRQSPRDVSGGRPKSPRNIIAPIPLSPVDMVGPSHTPRHSGPPLARPVAQHVLPMAAPTPIRPQAFQPAPQPPQPHHQPRQRTPRKQASTEYTPTARQPVQPSSKTRSLPTRQPVQRIPSHERSSPPKHIPQARHPPQRQPSTASSTQSEPARHPPQLGGAPSQGPRAPNQPPHGRLVQGPPRQSPPKGLPPPGVGGNETTV